MVDVLVLTQVCSRNILALSARFAAEIGPTTLYTGTDFGAERFPGLEIVAAPQYDNASFRARAKTWLAYVAGASTWLMRRPKRPSVLVLSTNPPLLPAVGWMFKRLRGWPYIVRVLDVYPDVLWRQGVVGRGHVVPRVWAGLNRRAFGEAAAVITLGEVMAETVAAYLPPGQTPQIIPSWVDTSTLVLRDKADNWFAKAHGQQDKLTVLYSGNLGLTHEFSGVEAAAARLLASHPEVHFLFIGGGAQQSRLQGIAARLDNVTWLDHQPWEVVPFSMTTGDVAIVTLGAGTEGISMPSKCYYMMAAGCAILGVTHGDNDVTRTIERHACGLSVAADDADAIEAALRRFVEEPEFLGRCRKNARRAAEQVFSAERCTAAYLQVVAAAALALE